MTALPFRRSDLRARVSGSRVRKRQPEELQALHSHVSTCIAAGKCDGPGALAGSYGHSKPHIDRRVRQCDPDQFAGGDCLSDRRTISRLWTFLDATTFSPVGHNACGAKVETKSCLPSSTRAMSATVSAPTSVTTVTVAAAVAADQAKLASTTGVGRRRSA